MTILTHTLTAALMATGLMSTAGCRPSIVVATPRPRIGVSVPGHHRPTYRPAPPVYHRPAPVIVRPPVRRPEPLIVRPGGCTTGQVIVSAPRPVHRPPVVVVTKPTHHRPTYTKPTYTKPTSRKPTQHKPAPVVVVSRSQGRGHAYGQTKSHPVKPTTQRTASSPRSHQDGRDRNRR
ncbi:MAG: hypothetical protein HN909_05255 [Phycisphaerales bacterium]|jgi:hypothetical protein|nr:hypothetical protein [Phycisphaerales bacterium]MBT7171160.1 hypothetical protein [Phycisphaerales bacterium]